jgi:hypothetical protein
MNFSQNVMADTVVFFIYVAIIVVMNFTIMNLMIAAILVQLESVTEVQRTTEGSRFMLSRERQAIKAERLQAAISNESLLRSQGLYTQADDMAAKRLFWQQINQSLVYYRDEFVYLMIRGLNFISATSSCTRMSADKLNPRWQTLQHYIFADDSIFAMFIQGCIILNAVVLALDSYGISATKQRILFISNSTLTSIFAVEMILKIIFGGVIVYAQSTANLFDGSVVIGSIIEISLTRGRRNAFGPIRALRLFRLIRLARIFRLFEIWPSLRSVSKLIIKSFRAMDLLSPFLLSSCSSLPY